MEINYRLIRSDRKTVAIQIEADGQIIVRAPKTMDAARIQQFVESKRNWIEKHISRQAEALPQFRDDELQQMIRHAREVIPQIAAYYGAILAVTYGKITIRRQRTRWGSCSSKGNLNFNCLLMLAPDEVIEYVVVHELCHRKEMNHSPQFWAEVARVIPNYKQCRRWLREKGRQLIGRLPDENSDGREM